jgi:tRNA (guanine10-N2)-methyltransferase
MSAEVEATADEDYTLLIEFVHKHLDFHDAELRSILEMNNIKVGTDCHFRALSIHDESHDSSSSMQLRRPFMMLVFPWSSIGSKFSVGDEEKKTTKGTTDDCPTIDLVSVLSRCTLIRSVIELWGYSETGPSIDDCITSVQNGYYPKRHREGKHLGKFAKQFNERTWSMLVHTLGCTYTIDEQNAMRSKFAFLNFPGRVQMKDPDDVYLYIREVELDNQGGAVYPRHSGVGVRKQIIPENDARPPLACYFGRVLGNNGLGRDWRKSNQIEQYSLKKRSYLGPTSMDSELSLIMTNLAQIQNRGSFVFDPFVGTGSILLTAASRGAFCFGTDIDLRVLRGRSHDENIVSNFKQYGLPPPELVRSDNAIYHRHFRNHLPLFDAIVTDPPYGIRAGAKKSGARKSGEVRPISDEHRFDHVAQTRPYAVSDVMADLLNVASATLKMGGKLVYIIPSMTDFNDAFDLPRHECLRLDYVCYQPLQMEYGRRIVTMTKVTEYDERRRKQYLEGTWVNGAESAEKVANIRERLIEAARVKPGYEEKALQRKAKRKSTKEAKKKVKREASAKIAEAQSDVSSSYDDL